jgi:uroporphyrinogen-III synthase
MSLPLYGRHVLITRGAGEGEKLASQVKEYGGIPHVIPLIDFKARTVEEDLEHRRKLFTYNWIIFTSKNGVRYFFEQVKNSPFHQITNRLPFKIAVIGSKTKEFLQKQYGFEADFMPAAFTALDFTEEFLCKVPNPGRVLIPKGNLAKDLITRSLLNKNIYVDEWIVYTTFLPDKSIDILKKALLSFTFDFALFTSPSAFQHFIKALEIEDVNFPEAMEIVSIGPATTRSIEAHGFKVSVSPDIHTMDSMIESLKEYILSGRNKQNE